jgi:hypothetical protein
MIKNVAVIIAIPFALIMSSCCTRTSWGTCVQPQSCKPIIAYSGHSFKIGEATIPIGGQTVNIKGVEWDTKTLQQAAAVSQAMDIQRVQQCQNLNSGLATLSYEEYTAERRRMLENQDKLNQLAYLIILGKESAVEKWIDSYSASAPRGVAAASGSSRTFDPRKPLVEVSVLKK